MQDTLADGLIFLAIMSALGALLIGGEALLLAFDSGRRLERFIARLGNR